MRGPHAYRSPLPLARHGRPGDHLPGWLTATGSLTARLRAHGEVRVQVISQGTRHLWAHERRVLGAAHGHVREVVLWLDAVPVVWARSAARLPDVGGPWRAVRGLGNRPLAEVLFNTPGIQRDPLRAHRWPLSGAEHARRRRQWLALPHAEEGTGRDAPPVWGRSSVFRHGEAPLLVTECFAATLSRLSARGDC